MADAKETVWITADNSKLIKGLKEAEQQTVKSAKKMEQAGKFSFGGARKNIDAMAVGLAKVFAVVKALEGAAKVVEGAIAGWKMRQAENNAEFGKALEQYDKMKASISAFPGLGPVIASIWNIRDAITGAREEMQKYAELEKNLNGIIERGAIASFELYLNAKKLGVEEEKIARFKFNEETKSIKNTNEIKDLEDKIKKSMKERADLMKIGVGPYADVKRVVYDYQKIADLSEQITAEEIKLTRVNFANNREREFAKTQLKKMEENLKRIMGDEDSYWGWVEKLSKETQLKIDAEKKVAEEKKRIAIETQEWISAQLIGDLKARLENEIKAKAAAQKAASDSDKFQLKRVSLSTAGFQTAGMRTQEDRKDQEKIAREKRIEKLQEEIKDNTRDTKNAIQVLSRGGASSNVARFNEP